MTTTTQLNGRRFGDFQARSFLPVSGRLSADVKWSQASSDDRHQAPPLHLALWGDDLIVQYPERLESRPVAGGPVTWSQTVASDFEFQLTDTGLTALGRAGVYTRYRKDGSAATTETLPLLADIVRLHAMEEIDGELRYAVATEFIPSSDPGEMEEPPLMSFHRFDPVAMDYSWSFEAEDDLIQVLRHPRDDRWSLVGAAGIHAFASSTDDPAAVTTMKADVIEAAAYDFDEQLLVVMIDQGQRRLRCLDDAGATVWEDLLANGALVQPPASRPGQHHYLLLGDELSHWHQGQLQWRYSVPFAGEHRPLFTVLEDGSILLTAGTHCIQLRSDGEELARVDTGGQLSCRPLMDAQGRVYLGSGPWIRCYQ